MITIRDILLGGVVPFAVALAVLVLAWRPWRREGEPRGFDVVEPAPAANDEPGVTAPVEPGRAIEPPRRAAWGGAVGIGLAFAAGYVGLFGRPPLPPTVSSGWLLYLTVPLVGLGLVDALLRPPAWLTALCVAAAAALAGYLLLEALVPYTFTSAAALWTWVAPVAVAAFLWWVALDGLAARSRGAGAPLVCFVVATGAAVVLMTSGSQTLGQLTGVVAAATAAAVVVAGWGRAPVLARGGAIPFVVLTLGLLTYARFYFDPPVAATNVLLLLIAPVVAWLADQALGRRARGWRHGLAVATAAAVPVAIAVTLSVVTFVREMGKTSSDYYSY